MPSSNNPQLLTSVPYSYGLFSNNISFEEMRYQIYAEANIKNLSAAIFESEALRAVELRHLGLPPGTVAKPYASDESIPAGDQTAVLGRPVDDSDRNDGDIREYNAYAYVQETQASSHAYFQSMTCDKQYASHSFEEQRMAWRLTRQDLPSYISQLPNGLWMKPTPFSRPRPGGAFAHSPATIRW